VCRAELVVALTWTEGIARKVRPGVYCPHNLAHMCENFNFETPGQAAEPARAPDCGGGQ
jgi:hypothetical protein